MTFTIDTMVQRAVTDGEHTAIRAFHRQRVIENLSGSACNHLEPRAQPPPPPPLARFTFQAHTLAAEAWEQKRETASAAGG